MILCWQARWQLGPRGERTCWTAWACQTALCPDTAAAYRRFQAARLVLGASAALGVAALAAGVAVGLDRGALLRCAHVRHPISGVLLGD